MPPKTKKYKKVFEDGSVKYLAHKSDKPKNMSRRTKQARADVRNAAIVKRRRQKSRG